MGLPWSIATSLVWSLQCIRQWFDFKLNWNSLNMGSFEETTSLRDKVWEYNPPNLTNLPRKKMVKGLEKQKIHLWPRKSFQNGFRRGTGRTQCVWHPSVENRPWVSFVATNLSLLRWIYQWKSPPGKRQHPSETFWKSITAIVGLTHTTYHPHIPPSAKVLNVSQKGVLFVNSNHTTHGESTCERSRKGRPVLDHTDKSCEIKSL